MGRPHTALTVPPMAPHTVPVAARPRAQPSLLRRRAGGLLLLLVAGCIVLPGATEVYFSYRETLALVERSQAAQAQGVSNSLAGILGRIRDELELTVALPWDLEGYFGGMRRGEYERLLNRLPGVERIEYIDAQNRLRLRVDQLKPDSGPDRRRSSALADPDELIAPGDCGLGGVQYRDGYAPLATLEPCRFEKGGGRTRAVLSLRDLQRTREMAEALKHEKREGQRMVVDARGVIQLHSDEEQMLRRRELPVALRGALLQPELAQTIGRDASDRQVVATALPIPDSAWWAVVMEPKSIALAPLHQTMWRTVGFLVAGLLAAAVAARAVAHRLTRPILALHEASRAIGRGELGTRVAVSTGDELQQVGEAFNAMAGRLQASYTELEARVAERTRDALSAQQSAEEARHAADAARAAAEYASRQKTDFLAHMSHELRTPLHALLGFSEALQEEMFGPLNAKQHEYVGEIRTSGQMLLQLINDLVDLAKIESGSLTLVWSLVDVPSILARCVLLVQERAHRKELRLTSEVDRAVDAWMLDERRFKQIVINLLTNAVKFTPAGGSVTLRAWQDPTLGLVVEVQDTGIGIPHERRHELFRRFSQLVDPGPMRAEGAGLGLALCRDFVEAHGGRIEFDSTPGRGSRFRFNVPAQVQP